MRVDDVLLDDLWLDLPLFLTSIENENIINYLPKTKYRYAYNYKTRTIHEGKKKYENKILTLEN